MNFFIYIGFSTATTAMKQTFMLHLFSTANNALQWTLRWVLCMTYWLGLTCYTHPQIYWVFWRKGYQNAGRIPMACSSSTMDLWLTVPVRSENFSLPLNNNRWFCWCRPVAWSPRLPDLTPMDIFLWSHIKALILLPILLRQQQPVIVVTHQSLPRCCRLSIEISGRMFEYLL